MPDLRVAVIGAGPMARAHLAAFAAEGAILSGIHSRTATRARALAAELGIELVCESVTELWERTEADVVVVATSVESIYEVAQACLEHPWVLLVEKPPGLDPIEARTLAAIAADRARTALVGLNRRSYSSTRVVLDEIEAIVGARFVRVQDQQDRAVASIHHPAEVVERYMYANSIHLIDYLNLFCRGSVEQVTNLARWTPSSPSTVLAHVTYDSGDQGLYEAVWHAPGPWSVSVTVPGRRWELRPLEQVTRQVLGSGPIAVPIGAWDTELKPGLRFQARSALSAAAGGRCDLPTLDDATATMELVAAIYR